MTKREMAICEIYTGICFLTGDNRKYAYEYASELLGFDIMTHEFLIFADKLKELSYDDFVYLCQHPED